jgi:hypothetical protein
VLALVVLVWLPLMNLYIYFNEVQDAHDRQVRREIGEMAGEAAGMDTMLLLPSVPRADEPLNNEYQMIELFMLQKLPSGQVAQSYRHVALEDLLPGLPYGLSERPNVEIILDKETANERPTREALSAALQRCYPKGTLTTGYFFNRYSLPAEALAAPACVGTALSLLADSNTQLSWSLSQGTATGVSLSCETQTASQNRIEAESLPIAPGWQPETAFAAHWNGSGFLMDNYGSQPLLYEFDSDQEGFVYLWMRSYKRAADDTAVQLTLNNQTQSLAASPQIPLNQWTWERVGPYPVHVGTNDLMIGRPYPGDPMSFMAIFLDTLIITTDEAYRPEENYFTALPIQHFALPSPQTGGRLTLRLAPGDYRCTIQVDSEQNLVDAFGNSPVVSNPVEIIVAP